jgi:hypothetical protein
MDVCHLTLVGCRLQSAVCVVQRIKAANQRMTAMAVQTRGGGFMGWQRRRAWTHFTAILGTALQMSESTGHGLVDRVKPLVGHAMQV